MMRTGKRLPSFCRARPETWYFGPPIEKLASLLLLRKVQSTMTYYFAKTLETDFESAVQRAAEALKAHGFGIITQIDVRDTFKSKIGVDFRNYRILGACNPQLAHEALQIEDKVGTMLPCNVVVQDLGGGQVEIAAIDPVASMMAIDNPELKRAAEQVRDKLQRAIQDI